MTTKLNANERFSTKRVGLRGELFTSSHRPEGKKKSNMATGDNGGRAPCLNFNSPGPLGNSQPSNSPYTLASNNGASSAGPGGSQGATRRQNPQPGPNGLESTGVGAGVPPNMRNAVPQAAAQASGIAGAPGGSMTAPAASNMTGSASNLTPAPAAHSLSAPPAAAAVLVYREPVYNWQATKCTVKERFAFLFNNEVLSDVHFLVGKGLGVQRIPAHR